MKVGIISDTHIIKDIEGFNDLLDTQLKEIDLLIHAGDYITNEIVEALKNFKKFIGVWGNVDNPEVKTLLNEKEIIDLEGYKVGICHGHGKEKSTLSRAYEKFKEDKVDIIIFGHSHQPLVKTKKGVLMLNPGSLTNKRQERWFSCIILELAPYNIDLQLKLFSKKI